LKFVIFGLTISSAWGNGHATLWRGLCRALAGRGHRVTFFEKDAPYYARTRDLSELAAGRLVLYRAFDEVLGPARAELADADACIVSSYCPDGVAAGELCLESKAAWKIFYDLDTPVTLAALEAGECPSYLGPRGLADFDLVLSFTGGEALAGLCDRLGARRVAPLYGHVDPLLHRPVPAEERFRGSLSYLGTFAVDRQASVEELFFEPARKARGRRFVLGGSMYPKSPSWPQNLVHYAHVAPADHAAFFCSSVLTLSVTRSTMARFGYCPSGRLFEAAACGVALASDWFRGLDDFFEPGRELFVVKNAEDVLGVLELGEELERVRRRARERVLAEHTAERRAIELEKLLSTQPATRLEV
jgi:spore maturation protein CgeB